MSRTLSMQHFLEDGLEGTIQDATQQYLEAVACNAKSGVSLEHMQNL
jgi:hypothetical protein